MTKKSTCEAPIFLFTLCGALSLSLHQSLLLVADVFFGAIIYED